MVAACMKYNLHFKNKTFRDTRFNQAFWKKNRTNALCYASLYYQVLYQHNCELRISTRYKRLIYHGNHVHVNNLGSSDADFNNVHHLRFSDSKCQH